MNLKVELANKVTMDERNQCGISNIIDGLTAAMSNAHGRKHSAHMNTKKPKILWLLDDLEWVVPNTGINC